MAHRQCCPRRMVQPPAAAAAECRACLRHKLVVVNLAVSTASHIPGSDDLRPPGQHRVKAAGSEDWQWQAAAAAAVAAAAAAGGQEPATGAVCVADGCSSQLAMHFSLRPQPLAHTSSPARYPAPPLRLPAAHVPMCHLVAAGHPPCCCKALSSLHQRCRVDPCWLTLDSIIIFFVRCCRVDIAGVVPPPPPPLLRCAAGRCMDAPAADLAAAAATPASVWKYLSITSPYDAYLHAAGKRTHVVCTIVKQWGRL